MALLAGLLVRHHIGEGLGRTHRRDEFHFDVFATRVERSVFLIGIPQVGRSTPFPVVPTHDDAGLDQTMPRQINGTALRIGRRFSDRQQLGVGAGRLRVIEGLEDRRANRKVQGARGGVPDLFSGRHIDRAHLQRVVGEQRGRQVVRDHGRVVRHRCTVAGNRVPRRQLGGGLVAWKYDRHRRRG